MANKINDLLVSSLTNIKDLVDVNVVIGSPITLGTSTAIPISKVKCGFISGGQEKKEPLKEEVPFFGAGAGSISITPIAFLVKNENDVKVLHLDNNTHVLEYILDSGITLVEEIFERFKNKNNNKSS